MISRYKIEMPRTYIESNAHIFSKYSFCYRHINQILNIEATIFQNGLIVVADRSNNRVQVFSGIGQYLHKFGVEGKGPGQFNKPASVCADSR